MSEVKGMSEQPFAPDLVQMIVDRYMPPIARRVIDHDINGRPIYADEVRCVAS